MTRTWWNTGALLLWLYASVVAAQSAPNWTRQIPQNFPLRRAGHAMAYDSAHGQAVLFGGSSPVLLNDTWVWDGSNWEQKSPQTSPPVRYFHAMAYDAAHGQVVLFGGTGPTPAGVDFGTEALNDTWVWDGSNWTQESPQTSPSVRYSPAMAYDAAHGQVVLFGGAALNPDGTMKELNDTWVWDGSNWTEKSPQTSPPVRDAHAMAFDSAHGQVVLFGGEGASFALLNDTWVWDGANWIQKSPQISPSARSGHAMAYDSAHGQVLLFGGVDDGQDINDTWV